MSRNLFFAAFLLLAAVVPAQLLDLRLAGANAATSSAAAQPRLIQSKKSYGLALTAHFRNDLTPRAFWDMPIEENLTHCAGVKMRIYCSRPELVRQYSIYIKAGKSWNTAVFSPQAANVWHDVFIPKADFASDAVGASWQNARCLRIALWKGATGISTLNVASLEFVRPTCPVAIIRSGTNAKEAAEANRYASNISDALTGMGLYPAVLERDDTNYLSLRPYKFAYLPMPKAFGRAQLANVSTFVNAGGKVAAFHALPEMLAMSMRMPFGRYQSQPGLDSVHFLSDSQDTPPDFQQPAESLIAVTPQYPVKALAVWMDKNGRNTQLPAILESTGGFWMTQAFLNKDPANAAPALLTMAAKYVPNLMKNAAYAQYETAYGRYYSSTHAAASVKEEARNMLNIARTQFGRRQYLDSILSSKASIDALARIKLDGMPLNPLELRAVWSSCDTGLPGSSWAWTAQMLEHAFFNTVFMQASSPLVSNYKSYLIPRYKIGQPFEKSLKACQAHGLQCHAWMHCLALENSNYIAQLQPIVDVWKQQGRLQLDAKGETLPWLCPSQIRNRNLAVRMATELALKYKIDGTHLDFIRFPKSDACVCQYCQMAFEKYIRRTCNWPAEVLPGGQYHAYWLAFRQASLTALVKDISNAARQARRNIKISAAVYPDLAAAKANVGQDWQTWLHNGYVDMVCPMDYQNTAQGFAGTIDRQMAFAPTPRTQLVPGIGVSVHNLTLNDVKQQIQATRQRKTAGFVLFRLDSREARDIIPNLFR